MEKMPKTSEKNPRNPRVMNHRSISVLRVLWCTL